MHIKLLEAIGKFLDHGYITQYTIEGYFGFAYLNIREFNTETMEHQVRQWKIDVVGEEVEWEDLGIISAKV
jgi:hypothetical protein